MNLINRMISDLITDFQNMNLEINNLNQIKNLKLPKKQLRNLFQIRSHKMTFLISLNFLSEIRIKKKLILKISKILDFQTSVNPLVSQYKQYNNPKSRNYRSRKHLLKLRYLLRHNNNHKIY